VGEGGGKRYPAPLLVDPAPTERALRLVVLDGVIAVGAIGRLWQAARTTVGAPLVLHRYAYGGVEGAEQLGVGVGLGSVFLGTVRAVSRARAVSVQWWRWHRACACVRAVSGARASRALRRLGHGWGGGALR
jgi:hypothetical protein